MDLVLIRLVNMSFNEIFPYPRCRYKGLTCGAGFNQIDGHGFQRDIPNPHSIHTEATSGFSFNQIGEHEFQRDIPSL